MTSKPDDLPWMEWFPRDFLSSSRVQRMSLEEQGAYRRLLDFQWMDGSIPADIVEIAKLLGVSKARAERIWLRVGCCFNPDRADPARLVNDRLATHRAKSEEKKRRHSEAGMTGANARWSDRQSHGNRIATALRPVCPSPTPSPAPKEAPSRAAPEVEKASAPSRQFTDGWQALFSKHRDGAAYAFEGGKDGGHVKAILKLAAGDVTEALRRAAVHLEDPFWAERGANLGTLRSQWNRCIHGSGNGHQSCDAAIAAVKAIYSVQPERRVAAIEALPPDIQAAAERAGGFHALGLMNDFEFRRALRAAYLPSRVNGHSGPPS